MTTAEIYVTAAYLVFLTIVLLYVVIYSFKVARLEHEVAELTQRSAAALDEGGAREQKQALVV